MDRAEHLAQGIVFNYDPEKENLRIKPTYNHVHPPYADFSVKPIGRQYTADNLKLSSATLCQNVMSDEGLREFCSKLTESQVRYIWHNLTSGTWLRGADPFCRHMTMPKIATRWTPRLLNAKGIRA